MTIAGSAPPAADPAAGWLGEASPEAAQAWFGVRQAADTDLPDMSLAAGERPAADVEVLASAAAACEYLMATRMHAAAAAGCLPLGERGGVLAARGWSPGSSHRLARCGAFALGHPSVAAAWAAGAITAEHVDPLARMADRFSCEEMAALVVELGPHWGSWSPAAILRFVTAADRMLHPPPDPTGEETDAYQTRSLSFAVTSDTVLISGELPRVDGEVVIAAIDAWAERLRSTADHVPATARRADALLALVNNAHATDTLPTRGGLPVSLSVTLEQTTTGDPVWQTSRGHQLTDAEARWASCDATITPVLVDTRACVSDATGGCAPGAHHPEHPNDAHVTPAVRVAALAALMFDRRMPLAVGRTQRTATPAQRRALAVRDGGCIIPGCQIPAEACQTHHLQEWAAGGQTSVTNMALVCWAHHRQVDLRMWTIQPLDPTATTPQPEPGAPPATPWPANHGAPFRITRTPRHQRRL
jgi:hypothetical protein